MFVYHWNPDTKVYVGSSEADESPLEPGVYLVPAFATLTVAPQTVANKHFLLWDEATKSWKETPIPEPEAAEPEEVRPPQDPMDLLRAERNSRLMQCDWVVIKAYSLGVPVTPEWAAYMQALRDLPAISTPTLSENGMLNLDSVAWPVKPSA